MVGIWKQGYIQGTHGDKITHFSNLIKKGMGSQEFYYSISMTTPSMYNSMYNSIHCIHVLASQTYITCMLTWRLLS